MTLLALLSEGQKTVGSCTIRRDEYDVDEDVAARAIVSKTSAVARKSQRVDLRAS